MGQCCSHHVTTATAATTTIRVNTSYTQESSMLSDEPSKYISEETSPLTSSDSTPQPGLLKPSPARHIQAFIARRNGNISEEERSEDEKMKLLHKDFGFARDFASMHDLGPEVGRGNFGHIRSATVKSGEFQGQKVAVKILSKAEMTTEIAIEDVRREVKIAKALSGHANLVQFHNAYEDIDSVYIVMELCEGGELLDRILSRGGKYAEEDAKPVVVQMLNAVSFIHLQGIVHRDLKPENFLFMTEDEASHIKAIDFGLADFVKPDEKLNDIVGSAYYVAPEVLQQSYGTEADIWSIGVIVYILLSGSRPFWAPTESGIFSAVKQAHPSYDEIPWPSISPEAKDFVQGLLNKDFRKRMTAAQALAHPWIRGRQAIPLDMRILKSVKSYLQASSLRRSALKALAKTLTEDDFFYIGAQFMLLRPDKDGGISLENFKKALLKSATEAMNESRSWKILTLLNALALQKMYFHEFCAATINVHQLEMSEEWEQNAKKAYELFDRKGNRLVSVEEVAEEMQIHETIPASVFLHDWVRLEDGKLSLTGFTNILLA